MEDRISKDAALAQEIALLQLHLENVGITYSLFKNISNDQYGIEISGLGRPLRYDNAAEFDKKAKTDMMNRGEFMDKAQFEAFGQIIKNQMRKKDHPKIHNDIGFEGEAFIYDQIYRADSTEKSTYVGAGPIHACQNEGAIFEEYMKEFSKLVLKSPKATIMVLAGLSGIYNNFIDSYSENIVLSVYGKSSKGKTTMLRAACSTWGNPNQLVEKPNTTELKLNRIAEERKLIITGIDDVLRGKKKDMLEMIFSFADGASRDSMTHEGKQFCGTTMMTSEPSLYDYMDSSQSLGQLYRLIPVKIEPGDLTDDHTHAEAIAEFIKSNYGLIVPRIAQYMLANYTRSSIIEEVDNLHNVIIADYPNMEDHARIVHKFAIINLIGKIFSESCNVNIDLKDINKILVTNFLTCYRAVACKIDLYERVMDYIKQDSLKPESERLLADSLDTYNHEKYFGYLDLCNVEDGVFIPTKRLEAFANGLEPTEILKREAELKKLGKKVFKLADYINSDTHYINNRMFIGILRQWAEENKLHKGEAGKRLARKRKVSLTGNFSDKDDQKEIMMYNVLK